MVDRFLDGQRIQRRTIANRSEIGDGESSGLCGRQSIRRPRGAGGQTHETESGNNQRMVH
jgi:hypothetical protein